MGGKWWTAAKTEEPICDSSSIHLAQSFLALLERPAHTVGWYFGLSFAAALKQSAAFNGFINIFNRNTKTWMVTIKDWNWAKLEVQRSFPVPAAHVKTLTAPSCSTAGVTPAEALCSCCRNEWMKAEHSAAKPHFKSFNPHFTRKKWFESSPPETNDTFYCSPLLTSSQTLLFTR